MRPLCIKCESDVDADHIVRINGKDFVVCQYCGYLSTLGEASGTDCILNFEYNPPIDSKNNPISGIKLYVPTKGSPINRNDYMKLYKIDPEIAINSEVVSRFKDVWLSL